MTLDLWSQQSTKMAVDEFYDQIENRLMTSAPSRVRLIQLYMSKQVTFDNAVPAEWKATAKGYYVKALRSAQAILVKKHSVLRTSPRKDAAIPSRKSSNSTQLFCSPNSNNNSPSTVPNDAVAAEIAVWELMSQETIEKYRHPESMLLDEFTMAYEHRRKCPCHYLVFRQCASHRGTEAKCEQVFSGSKNLSDWNMNPDFLKHVVKMKENKVLYKPTSQEVWKLYQSKYRTKRDYETFHSDSEPEEESSSESSGDDLSDLN